jgi:hypothetical protein
VQDGALLLDGLGNMNDLVADGKDHRHGAAIFQPADPALEHLLGQPQ